MLPPTSTLGTRRGVKRVTRGPDVDVGGGPRATSLSEIKHAGPVLPDRGLRVSV